MKAFTVFVFKRRFDLGYTFTHEMTGLIQDIHGLIQDTHGLTQDIHGLIQDACGHIQDTHGHSQNTQFRSHAVIFRTHIQTNGDIQDAFGYIQDTRFDAGHQLFDAGPSYAQYYGCLLAIVARAPRSTVGPVVGGRSASCRGTVGELPVLTCIQLVFEPWTVSRMSRRICH
jgi:hypothetical protein